MRKTTKILNVIIDVITMKNAVKTVENFITEPKPHLVVTANAEMIMLAQDDSELKNIINTADLVVPDGAGTVLAARYSGVDMPERVAGFDLVQNLLAEASSKKYRVYFFGGAPGIAEKAKEVAEQRYPGITIAGIRNGFFKDTDAAKIIDDIKSCKPDILLVALGVPKQEKWLAKYMNELNVPVCIGVGGTFDVMAGTVQRAPLWMQNMHLEWLFRLLCQPQRAMRMLALPLFVIRVIGSKNK